MLYHLFSYLTSSFSGFNVFHYITFRTFSAILTAFLISLWFGPKFIAALNRLHMAQAIRNDGPKTHFQKAGTPTMGGTLILTTMLASILLWMDLKNSLLWVVVFIVAAFGCIGLIDDYLKISKKNPKGLKGWKKLFWEFLFSGIAAILLYYNWNVDSTLSLPFLKSVRLDLGIFYLPFVMIVIVGTANAVNLTDGLDGLAIGPIMISAVTYLFLTYVSGHAEIASYLQIPFIRGSGELAIFCGILIGAGLGFLWFNSFPATIMMGDVGSLALGGALGTLAVISKHEILLMIVGGIFVIEALSVMAQVLSFKLTGKRVFKMAPIHHHFELKGWAEPKVIVRFWIISILLSIVALSTLKLR